MFELSRSYQHRLLDAPPARVEEIRKALDGTPQLFPARAAIACQGVEGAYSQLACERLFFQTPDIFYFSNFEAVFAAVDKGLCRYGVVPLENSTAGSVNAVYDLMMRYHFSIVRSVRLKVDHCLLARQGAALPGIREIYSHEQAIGQCGRFLQSLPDVRVVRCANTAEAARLVAESEGRMLRRWPRGRARHSMGWIRLRSRCRIRAAISPASSASPKGWKSIRARTGRALMMTLPHKPGSLARVLSRFYAMGVNLNKLESRPLPERNFEFMFYFDLEAPVYEPRFLQLMGELDELSENCFYLGSYSEVI